MSDKAYRKRNSVACVAGSLRRFKKEQKSDEGEGGKEGKRPAFPPISLPFVAFSLFLEST